MSERVLSGAPASPGLAIGHARVLSHPSEVPARDPGPTREPAAEVEHALKALRQAAAELEAIAAALRDDGRPDDAEIVETGALMAADPLLESAAQRVPFGGGQDTRQHVERDQPLLRVRLAIDRKGDADAAEQELGFAPPIVEDVVGNLGEPAP